MTMMDPDDLDSNVVGIASFLYIIADLETTVRNVKNNLQIDNYWCNYKWVNMNKMIMYYLVVFI